MVVNLKKDCYKFNANLVIKKHVFVRRQTSKGVS